MHLMLNSFRHIQLKPDRFRNGNRSKPSPPNMSDGFENTYGVYNKRLYEDYFVRREMQRYNIKAGN